jgi:signal transduction histidine kinase
MGVRMIAKGRNGHFGLNGMRERAAGLGAKLSLDSRRGAGTTVILTIPGDVAYA